MSTITKRQFLAYGIGALALAGAGYGWTKGAGATGVERRFMTVGEMKAANAVIVDIRTPAEWRETGVIEGARLVTFGNAQSFLAQLAPDLADGRDLVLICRSGNRSSAAADALAGLIPNRIISIDGGMKREIAAGYRTVPPI